MRTRVWRIMKAERLLEINQVSMVERRRTTLAKENILEREVWLKLHWWKSILEGPSLSYLLHLEGAARFQLREDQSKR